MNYVQPSTCSDRVVGKLGGPHQNKSYLITRQFKLWINSTTFTAIQINLKILRTISNIWSDFIILGFNHSDWRTSGYSEELSKRVHVNYIEDVLEWLGVAMIEDSEFASDVMEQLFEFCNPDGTLKVKEKIELCFEDGTIELIPKEQRVKGPPGRVLWGFKLLRDDYKAFECEVFLRQRKSRKKNVD